jgi:hypothetical protein
MRCMGLIPLFCTILPLAHEWKRQALKNIDMKLFVSLTVWMVLLVLCWPLAILLIVLYPIIWLILLPFRILGWGVTLSLSMITALFMLPFARLR